MFLSNNGKALINGYTDTLRIEMQLPRLKHGKWFIEHRTEGK